MFSGLDARVARSPGVREALAVRLDARLCVCWASLGVALPVLRWQTERIARRGASGGRVAWMKSVRCVEYRMLNMMDGFENQKWIERTAVNEEAIKWN